MSNINVNINLKSINGENPVGEGNIIIDKETLGLDNVDNTSDADKPVSSATMSALNNKEDKTNKKTSLTSPDNTTYPTTKAVSDAISLIDLGDKNVQSDWNQANISKDDYIKNKPSLLELGETSTKAYRGDRGKTAYSHSQQTSGNPHGVSKNDIGLGNVNNTSDANKPISTATATALDEKEDKTNKKTSLTSPNNTTYPTTKAVSDAIGNGKVMLYQNGIGKGNFTLNQKQSLNIDLGEGIHRALKIIKTDYELQPEDDILILDDNNISVKAGVLYSGRQITIINPGYSNCSLFSSDGYNIEGNNQFAIPSGSRIVFVYYRDTFSIYVISLTQL